MKSSNSPVALSPIGAVSTLLLIMGGLTPLLATDAPAQLELSALDGINGFTLNGIVASGARVAGAGDVNGDGFPDFYVSDSSTSPNGTNCGQVFVVFGTGHNCPAIFELSSLDGTNGFTLNGVAREDRLSVVSERPGDVNGDGINDLMVAAPQADPRGSSSGETYVVFGTDQGFPAEFELTSLNGANGFTIKGVAYADLSGTDVSFAGDFNNDGIDDIVIGASTADVIYSFQGAAYVVFGSDQPFPQAIDLASPNGMTGFTLVNTVEVAGGVGSSVSGAGDVNNDGIDDIIIGAISAGGSGESYVVFGTAHRFPAVFELTGLDGANGFAIRGASADTLGYSVNAAGDVNGDGIGDVIVGSAFADANGRDSGRSYVVFGSAEGFAATMDASSLNGRNGFVFNGIAANHRAGTDVSGAGDVNGDGIDDVVVGALHASPNGLRSGQGYVVYGSAEGFPAVIEASSLDGSNGFALNGIDQEDAAGGSVSGIGDINGDGLDDLLIGATRADPDGIQRGQVYVVYGVDWRRTEDAPARGGSWPRRRKR
jgi:hypothetical protein